MRIMAGEGFALKKKGPSAGVAGASGRRKCIETNAIKTYHGEQDFEPIHLFVRYRDRW